MTEYEKQQADMIYNAIEPELVKDIPSASIAVGNPAKVVKNI